MSSPERHDPVQGKIVHEYDGILEADNELPRWWLGIFVGGVLFAGAYWFVYETWEIAAYPVAEYRAEMAAAAASGGGEVTDELLQLLVADATVVERGRTAFGANCVVCHGSRAEGNIGPNLTDELWVHGGAPTDVHRTVREGVGARGMPAWGPVLGEETVQAISAYVLTLRDTNVPGRAPEGEPWVPGAAAAPEEAPNSEDAPGADEAPSAEPAPSDPSAELGALPRAHPEI